MSRRGTKVPGRGGLAGAALEHVTERQETLTTVDQIEVAPLAEEEFIEGQGTFIEPSPAPQTICEEAKQAPAIDRKGTFIARQVEAFSTVPKEAEEPIVVLESEAAGLPKSALRSP